MHLTFVGAGSVAYAKQHRMHGGEHPIYYRFMHAHTTANVGKSVSLPADQYIMIYYRRLLIG